MTTVSRRSSSAHSKNCLLMVFLLVISGASVQARRDRRIRLTNSSLRRERRRTTADMKRQKRPKPCVVEDPKQIQVCRNIKIKKERWICMKNMRSKHGSLRPCPVKTIRASTVKARSNSQRKGRSNAQIRIRGRNDRFDKPGKTRRIQMKGHGGRVSLINGEKKITYQDKRDGSEDSKIPRDSKGFPIVVNLVNLHTREVLPLLHYRTPKNEIVNEFLRCRWTQKNRRIDMKVFKAILDSAMLFHGPTIEIISGFRHIKFNEMLRKKGRNVARRSKHLVGKAIDFRVLGVNLRSFYEHLMSLRIGGVGIYTESGFLHLDSGPVRTWSGK